jgi:hypothetical protein
MPLVRIDLLEHGLQFDRTYLGIQRSEDCIFVCAVWL